MASRGRLEDERKSQFILQFGRPGLDPLGSCFRPLCSRVAFPGLRRSFSTAHGGRGLRPLRVAAPNYATGEDSLRRHSPREILWF